MSQTSIENKLPVAKDGLAFIIIPLVVGLIAILISWWLAVPILLFASFSAWFFRDPERQAPAGDENLVSPADGKVILVGEVDEDRFLHDKVIKISIFMSIFNVHVNRAPLSGRVKKTDYFPGKFFRANLDKSSQENEHNAIVLQAPNQKPILFVQIAGLVARRIVCWIMPGDDLVRGQRVGMIRFGSRLDVYLPLEADVQVQVGQNVTAGESVLARMPAPVSDQS